MVFKFKTLKSQGVNLVLCTIYHFKQPFIRPLIWFKIVVDRHSVITLDHHPAPDKVKAIGFYPQSYDQNPLSSRYTPPHAGFLEELSDMGSEMPLSAFQDEVIPGTTANRMLRTEHVLKDRSEEIPIAPFSDALQSVECSQCRRCWSCSSRWRFFVSPLLVSIGKGMICL